MFRMRWYRVWLAAIVAIPQQTPTPQLQDAFESVFLLFNFPVGENNE
jgi:hypothetical protein